MARDRLVADTETFRYEPPHNYSSVDQEAYKPSENCLDCADSAERIGRAQELRTLASAVVIEKPLQDAAMELCQHQVRAV